MQMIAGKFLCSGIAPEVQIIMLAKTTQQKQSVKSINLCAEHLLFLPKEIFFLTKAPWMIFPGVYRLLCAEGGHHTGSVYSREAFLPRPIPPPLQPTDRWGKCVVRRYF